MMLVVETRRQWWQATPHKVERSPSAFKTNSRKRIQNHRPYQFTTISRIPSHQATTMTSTLPRSHHFTIGQAPANTSSPTNNKSLLTPRRRACQGMLIHMGRNLEWGIIQEASTSTTYPITDLPITARYSWIIIYWHARKMERRSASTNTVAMYSVPSSSQQRNLMSWIHPWARFGKTRRCKVLSEPRGQSSSQSKMSTRTHAPISGASRVSWPKEMSPRQKWDVSSKKIQITNHQGQLPTSPRVTPAKNWKPAIDPWATKSHS